MSIGVILGIIGAVLGIIGTGGFFGMRDRYKKALKEYGKKVEEETTLKNKLTSLHNRVDGIEKSVKDREETCPMKDKIIDHSKDIKDLQDEGKVTAVVIGEINTKLTFIAEAISDLKKEKKDKE